VAHHLGRKAVVGLDPGAAAAAAAGEDPAAVFRTQDAEVGGLQALADKEWIAGS
jgi:hypothetical protein